MTVGTSERRESITSWQEWSTQVDIDLNALRSYTQATYAITEEYLASPYDEQLRETVDLSGVGLGIPTVQWILSGVIVGCHTEFCVTMHNEKVLNSVQNWLPDFSAMYHYTKFDMASFLL